jgi:hypothetical protein
MIKHGNQHGNFDICAAPLHEVEYYSILIDGKYAGRYDTELTKFLEFLCNLSTALPKSNIEFECVCRIPVLKYTGRNGTVPTVSEAYEEIQHERYYGAWGNDNVYHIARSHGATAVSILGNPFNG